MTDSIEADAAWDRARRDETETERLDRNWRDLLQELRVVQTGVQLLTGFLLTLPFQQRFTRLPTASRDLYVAAVGCAVAATAVLVAPVAVHRLLFRRHARRPLVATSHRLALAGLALLGLAICAALQVIVTEALSSVAGWVAAGVAVVVFTALWLAYPLLLRDETGR